MEYGDKVKIECEKTGYSTEIEFKVKGMVVVVVIMMILQATSSVHTMLSPVRLRVLIKRL